MRRSAGINKDSAADGNTQPLASFPSLPYELQARIVELACFHEDYHLCLDLEVAQNLRLVSPDVSSLATPQLFKTLMITRPSRLRSFLDLLMARPMLGQLVKTLHIGADDHLPDDWWPMLVLNSEYYQGRSEIVTSLEDAAMLPRWCCSRRRWVYNLSPHDYNLNPQDEAVLNAIQAAQKALDVSLARPQRSWEGKHLYTLSWLTRVMEVQAALDLYLIEMRRLEDVAGVSVSSHKEKPYATRRRDDGARSMAYPPMLIAPATGTATCNGKEQKSASQFPPFVVTRARLLQHLARPGGGVDWFDHPLIFARSGLQVLELNRFGLATGSARLLQQVSALCYNDLADHGSSGDAHKGRGDPLDVVDQPTLSIGGILALTRSLLALTSSIQNLYLTGFLQMVLTTGAAVCLPTLRGLYLGPLSIHSVDSLPPALLEQYPNLEQLRFMGCAFAERKRACIAALPRLKKVEWAMEHSPEPFAIILEAFRPLIDEVAFAQDRNTFPPLSTKRSRALSEEDEEAESYQSQSEESAADADAASERRLPEVVIALRGAGIDALDALLTKRAVAARCAGHSLGHHSRRVILCGLTVNGFGEERWDGASQDVILAYQAFREWWEECLTGEKSRWERDDDF